MCLLFLFNFAVVNLDFQSLQIAKTLINLKYHGKNDVQNCSNNPKIQRKLEKNHSSFIVTTEEYLLGYRSYSL